ncbi:unnamed protein product [Sphagnum balticum]
MLRHIASLRAMGRSSDSVRGGGHETYNSRSASSSSSIAGVFGGACNYLYHPRQLIPYFLRSARPMLLQLCLLITISVLLEVALEQSFEASVGLTELEDNRFSTTHQAEGQQVNIWVNLPVDRPGEGFVSIPLHLFKITMVDRFIMPLLFAFMLLFSSMAFVFSMGLMDSW